MFVLFKKKNILFNNIFALVLMQVFNFIPFLIVPFLARVLGVEAYGEVLSLLSVITLSYIFIEYGFNVSATYRVTKSKDNYEILSEICSNVITLRIVIALFLIILYVVDFCFFKVFFESWLMVFLVSFTVFSQSLISDWFFQGIEKMFNIAIYTIFLRVFYGLSIFLFISDPNDSYLVILFWGMSNAVAGLISCYFMIKKGVTIKFCSLKNIQNELVSGWLFFKSRLSVAVYTSLNSVLLAAFNPLQLAFYSIGDQAYKASQSVTSPINRALYPYMVRTKNWDLFFKIFIIMFLLIIIVSIALYINAEVVIKFIFGSAYKDSIVIFKVFLLTSIVTYVGLSFGNPVFGAINRLDIPNKISIYASYLHLVILLFIFTFYQFNAFFIACALLVTEVFVALTRMFFFLRCYNEKN